MYSLVKNYPATQYSEISDFIKENSDKIGYFDISWIFESNKMCFTIYATVDDISVYKKLKNY